MLICNGVVTRTHVSHVIVYKNSNNARGCPTQLPSPKPKEREMSDYSQWQVDPNESRPIGRPDFNKRSNKEVSREAIRRELTLTPPTGPPSPEVLQQQTARLAAYQNNNSVGGSAVFSGDDNGGDGSGYYSSSATPAGGSGEPDVNRMSKEERDAYFAVKRREKEIAELKKYGLTPEDFPSARTALPGVAPIGGGSRGGPRRDDRPPRSNSSGSGEWGQPSVAATGYGDERVSGWGSSSSNASAAPVSVSGWSIEETPAAPIAPVVPIAPSVPVASRVDDLNVSGWSLDEPTPTAPIAPVAPMAPIVPVAPVAPINAPIAPIAASNGWSIDPKPAGEEPERRPLYSYQAEPPRSAPSAPVVPSAPASGMAARRPLPTSNGPVEAVDSWGAVEEPIPSPAVPAPVVAAPVAHVSVPVPTPAAPVAPVVAPVRSAPVQPRQSPVISNPLEAVDSWGCSDPIPTASPVQPAAPVQLSAPIVAPVAVPTVAPIAAPIVAPTVAPIQPTIPAPVQPAMPATRPQPRTPVIPSNPFESVDSWGAAEDPIQVPRPAPVAPLAPTVPVAPVAPIVPVAPIAPIAPVAPSVPSIPVPAQAKPTSPRPLPVVSNPLDSVDSWGCADPMPTATAAPIVSSIPTVPVVHRPVETPRIPEPIILAPPAPVYTPAPAPARKPQAPSNPLDYVESWGTVDPLPTPAAAAPVALPAAPSLQPGFVCCPNCSHSFKP